MGVRQGRFCDYVPHSGAISSDADVKYQITKLENGEPVKGEDGEPIRYEFDSYKCGRNWLMQDYNDEQEAVASGAGEASSESGESGEGQSPRRRGGEAAA